MVEQQTIQRIALGLEYDGSNYHGWQSQNITLKTLQNTVQNAISRVADQPIKIFCAGRTDVGVHATDQVIHFDTNKNRPMYAWILGVNNYLPKDIRIQWAKEVPQTFHARFSATARHYRYIVHNSKHASALLHKKVLWYPWQKLNEQAMHQAILPLLGEHDFSAFRASSCQSLSTKRSLYIAQVERKNGFVIIDIKANAFLHHMVRNIVGSLLLVGNGEKPVNWIKELLINRDRKQGGATAKATGLYLLDVTYPEDYLIPQTIKSCISFAF